MVKRLWYKFTVIIFMMIFYIYTLIKNLCFNCNLCFLFIYLVTFMFRFFKLFYAQMKRTMNKITTQLLTKSLIDITNEKSAKINNSKTGESCTSKVVPDIENNVLCTLSNEKLPENIAEHIKNIQKMREKNDAPVDTMGCHMLADSNADPKVFFIDF